MIDLSSIGFFNPIFSFVLLFVIVFAILQKSKILGESKPIQVIVALVLSLIFISVVEVRGYVESVIPWFAVLIVALFFVVFIAALGMGKTDAIAKPWFIGVFIAILAIAFIYQGYNSLNVASNQDYISIKNWLSDSRIYGGLWLVIFGAIATFAITRKAK
ncbi:MAG: hypothetical protein KKB21_03890 [Nanoarchaeota archaeon]|nr:hypothetical protein [Nanoarchaeota archaeon]MBU4086689.1 hypothetical protein [Nanoarchaeota archaeon]